MFAALISQLPNGAAMAVYCVLVMTHLFSRASTVHTSRGLGTALRRHTLPRHVHPLIQPNGEQPDLEIDKGHVRFIYGSDLNRNEYLVPTPWSGVYVDSQLPT